MVCFCTNSFNVFFIETKFISKLFKKFRRENESQEIPRLRLFIISSNRRFLNKKNLDLVHRTSGNFEIFRFSDIQNTYFPRMLPYFLVFLNKLTVIGRVTGPDFDKNLEVPRIIKKVLESIRNR